MNRTDNNNSNNIEEEKEISNLFRWYLEVGRDFDYVPEEERNNEKAFALLKKAEVDLITAKNIFKKKIYSNAITSTQQSVEKIGKSILLFAGFCKEEELKDKYGHNFSITLIKELRKLFVSFINYTEEDIYSKSVKKIDSFLSDYWKKREKLELIQDYNQLKALLTNYDIVASFFFLGVDLLENQDVLGMYKKGLIESSDEIFQQYEELSEIKLDKQDREKLQNEYSEYIKENDPKIMFQNTLITIFLLFYITILSMNLDMHYELSNYPERIDDFYTKKSDIIKLLPLFLKTISKIIDHYWYLLSLNMPEE